MDKALQKSLKTMNIKLAFRVSRVWPLNLVAMVKNFGPNDVFTIAKQEEHELSYHSNAIDEFYNNEVVVTVELLNIA